MGDPHQDAEAGALDAADHLTIDHHLGPVDPLDDGPQKWLPD